MDVIKAVRNYVDSIVSDRKCDGMKALILDKETTKIVSMVYTQSQILAKEVYLVETLEAEHERMTHLKAACFLRPTQENLRLLEVEFKKPKYCEYHLFFSNVLPENYLQSLAKADELEVVKQVQEYYGDFLAVNEDLFHLNMSNTLSLHKPDCSSGQRKEIIDDTVNGVLAVLLALKRKPFVRFQASSPIATQIADGISSRITEAQDQFHFRRQGSAPVLLIVDRCDDPVTPLLSQWTYQAQVHELLGLDMNRVDLSNVPDLQEDLRSVVLSATQDVFFRENMHKNFGDLGIAVKEMLDDFQKQTKSNENIESIEDMQRFLENFPAFKSHSLNVSKHVALMGELAAVQERRCLMSVAALEQELATQESHAEHLVDLEEKLASGSIRNEEKLRLAMLYALRYERRKDHQTTRVLACLRAGTGVRSAPLTQQQSELVNTVLSYGGAAKRGSDLYGDRSWLRKVQKNVKQGLKGVDNVYTRHSPLLLQTVEALCKGKLKDSDFPVSRFCQQGASTDITREKIKQIVVFVIGGCTFEEELECAQLNAKGEVNIVLGGSCIQNSESFMKELMDFVGPTS